MNTSNSTTLRECVTAITQLVELHPNISSIQQTLRVARLKLGLAIERLESLGQQSDVLEQLRDHSESVTFEIDTLLKTIRN